MPNENLRQFAARPESHQIDPEWPIVFYPIERQKKKDRRFSLFFDYFGSHGTAFATWKVLPKNLPIYSELYF